MNNILALLGAGFGLLVSIKVLITKSDLEQVFLTTEQTIKMKFYRLIGISASIGILMADLYFIWCLIIEGQTYPTVDWNVIIGIAVLFFILSLMFIGIITSFFTWVFAKFHYKYKVNIEDIGDVYIIKMMNQDVCICSKDPNADFNQNDNESYLIGVDDLMKKPLYKMNIQRRQNFFQKLIKYNAPNE